MRSSADCDREQAVEEADLGGRDTEHGIAELLVLDPARTRVVTLVGDFVVRDRVNVDTADPVFAAAADTDDIFGMPTAPAATSSIRRAIGGMYRYSRPTQVIASRPSASSRIV